MQASIQPELFLKSLSNQKFSEGRSGSFFCFSPDKCFIIKTIPESEAKLLNKILPAYYQVPDLATTPPAADVTPTFSFDFIYYIYVLLW